jgi:hypothetical protein
MAVAVPLSPSAVPRETKAEPTLYEIKRIHAFLRIDMHFPQDVIPSGAAALSLHLDRSEAAPEGSKTADTTWPAVPYPTF